MTPNDIDRLADAIADRLASLLANADDPVGDSDAAAEWIVCSKPTIERMVRDGRIPSFTVGRLRRFRRSEVLAAMKADGGEQ
jgi:excisionase family DNA binding protein